jgi:hypothetical protein
MSFYLAPVFIAGIFICAWLNKRHWQKKNLTFDKITNSIAQEETCSDKKVSIQKPEPFEAEYIPNQISWRHKRIHKFYQKHVAPYEKILETSGYLKSVIMLLSLLDTHGNCPSVIQAEQDHEYQAVANVYDLLARITLLDHCLNVAEQMISEITRAKTKDPEMIMGKILVTALGHDIGKIPGLMDAQCRKGDHSYISYLVLKNVIFTQPSIKNSPQYEDILIAVKSHHFQIQEGFTYDLRKADQAAREMEAETLSMHGKSGSDLVRIIQEQKASETGMPGANLNSKKKGKIPETVDLSWLNLDEFLGRIDPEINRIENNGYFRAFSMNNGLVYIMLSLVSEIVIYLAKANIHNNILVNADSTEKKRRIEFTIKTMLAEKDLIPSFIGKGFSGARFALIDANGKKKMVGIYMPIEARAFLTSLAELEKRKINGSVIKEIVEVRPLVGRKK